MQLGVRTVIGLLAGVAKLRAIGRNRWMVLGACCIGYWRGYSDLSVGSLFSYSLWLYTSDLTANGYGLFYELADVAFFKNVSKDVVSIGSLPTP